MTLTRASQTVYLSQRGDERFPSVKTADVRVSRAFRFGTRRITPEINFFNIGNAAPVVALNSAVGSRAGSAL